MRRTSLILGLVAVGFAARAGDAIPFFRPDPRPVYGPPEAHPFAPECAIDDAPCLKSHDDQVVRDAAWAGDVELCQSATDERTCRIRYEAARMEAGDVDVKLAHDPIADDPCSFVMRVDRGIATLYNRRWAKTTRVRAGRLKTATYVGKCDLDLLMAPAGPLPGFWGAASPAASTPAKPTAPSAK